MVAFLLFLSLLLNVSSYYVHRKISEGLIKQSASLEKYEKQKTALKGHLMTSVLKGA